MKYLITESQLNDLIPLKVKRKYREIDQFLDRVFIDKKFGEVKTEAYKRDKDEFTDAVVSLAIIWLFGIHNESLHIPIRFLFKDKIESYWNKANK
jgi:hypothetical protein